MACYAVNWATPGVDCFVLGFGSRRADCMPANRAFFSQAAVDRWLAEGRAGLEGEVLGLLPAGPSFKLSSAVLFGAEVAAGNDGPGLTGKVKALSDIEALSGEHVPGSVVIGDYAYEVVEGFLGELLDGERSSVAALETLLELAEAG